MSVDGKENQPQKSPQKSPIKSETFYHKSAQDEPVKKFNLDLVETDFDELQKLTKPVEEEEQIDSPPEDNEPEEDEEEILEKLRDRGWTSDPEEEGE